MKIFNAFQIVCLFVAGPFIISWLKTAPFTGATILMWPALIAYVIGFGFHVAGMRSLMEFDR